MQSLGILNGTAEAMLRVAQILSVLNGQVVCNEPVEVEGGLVGGHVSVSVLFWPFELGFNIPETLHAICLRGLDTWWLAHMRE